MTRSVSLPHTVAVIPHVVGAAPRRSSPRDTGQRSAKDGCAMPWTTTGIVIFAGVRPAVVLVIVHSTRALRETKLSESQTPTTSKYASLFPLTPRASIVMGDGLTRAHAVSGSAVHVTVMISPSAAVVPEMRVNTRAMLVDGVLSALCTLCSDTTVFWLKLTMLPSMCVGAALGNCVGTLDGAAVRHVHTGHVPARRRV